MKTTGLALLPPGTPVDIDNCAAEPIHVPGAIQPHGALLVIRLADGQVLQASETASAVLGVTASAEAGTPLAAILGPAPARELIDRPGAGPRWQTVIVAGRPFDLLSYSREAGYRVLEFDPLPVGSPNGRGGSATPAGSDARDGGADPLDVVALLDGIRGVADVEDLLAHAVVLMRGITGHDRVWAYRFEPDGHGVIVAEAKPDRLTSLLGHHFPEGDIPAQARALYLRTGMRTIFDSHAEAVPVRPAVNPDTGAWTDMSDSALRAVSPMHIAYLQQMGVRASMSAAIVVDDRLWGLLAAHHYSAPRRLSRAARGLTEVLARLVSLQVGALTRTQAARELTGLATEETRVLEAVAAADDLVTGLLADPDALLGVCHARGAIVRIGTQLSCVGETPPVDRCAALLEDLARTADAGELVTDCLSEALPGFADVADHAAGVLALPLSRHPGNLIAWLRPEQVRELTWGNPTLAGELEAEAGAPRLSPQGSFEVWRETVRLRSRPWAEVEIATAHELRSALGVFILSRAEALARANAELVRANIELDALTHVAAHDLREPLRAMNRLATFLVEDSWEQLDPDAQGRLARLVMHARRMAGLLDSVVAYAELSRVELHREAVSVRAVAQEAAEGLALRLEESGGQLRFADDAVVWADRARLREVFVQLIDNALTFTSGAAPDVEIGVMDLTASAEGPRLLGPGVHGLADGPAPPVIYVSDNGCGIPRAEREDVFGILQRRESGHPGATRSGAGLAIVRRLVELHGGRVWIEDGPAGGIRVCWTLSA